MLTAEESCRAAVSPAGQMPRGAPAGLARTPPARPRSESDGCDREVDAPGPLVVEFFGPAGVGKSTVAAALREHLCRRGIPARLVASARMTNDEGACRRGCSAPIHRVSALLFALSGIRHLVPGDAAMHRPMALLPAGSWIRSIRARRYLADLCRVWMDERRPGEVLILDQGFVTFLCSLALIANPIDRPALAQALALIPRADLLIHLSASRAVLEERLAERLHGRAMLKRILGNDLKTWMRQAELASVLDGLLTESGRAPLRLTSQDRSDLDTGLEAILAQVRVGRGGILQ